MSQEELSQELDTAGSELMVPKDSLDTASGSDSETMAVEALIIINGDTEEAEAPLGQRRYNRDFLLSFQFNEECEQHPPSLQNAEYIRKEMSKRSETRYDLSDFELPSKGNVELRKAEKRWVRPSGQCDKEPGDDKETEELFRKFVAILNNLTPQKFETLAKQALDMPIDTEYRLKGCIDLIFIKALDESSFSSAYAQMCRVLSKISVEVEAESEGKKKKTFRSLLLAKCQQEFEKDKESDVLLTKLRKKVDEAANPEERKQREDELEVKEFRARWQNLGNIRFIGELFKIKMLSEGIMHECIRRLLQSTTDDDALECFSKLMATIGKDLDHEKGHGLIKQYMDRVQWIIDANKISSRTKFFLQDVLELRKSNWVPRQRDNIPKKIDQEAKLEEHKEKIK